MWGYQYKIPITTKSPSLGHPHVYLPLGPLPPPAGASTVCGTITKFLGVLIEGTTVPGLLSLFKTPISTWGKIRGERGKASKGEGSRENLQKVLLLQICRGDGVSPSRVIRDEYRM